MKGGRGKKKNIKNKDILKKYQRLVGIFVFSLSLSISIYLSILLYLSIYPSLFTNRVSWWHALVLWLACRVFSKGEETFRGMAC